MFKPEQVSMEIVNLSMPKNIEREDMYAQNEEVRTYESAENEHETMEQPHVVGENVRQLEDRRAIKRSNVYGCPMMYVAKKFTVNLNEAMKSEKRELRKKAMRDEMKSHHENKAWTLVEKPKNQKILSDR
jgi:DnaJ-domain-containing protein 1